MKNLVLAFCIVCVFASSASAGIGVVRKIKVDEVKVTCETNEFGAPEFHYTLTVSGKAEKYDECTLEGVANILHLGNRASAIVQSSGHNKNSANFTLAPAVAVGLDGSISIVSKLDEVIVQRIVRTKADTPTKPAFDVYLNKKGKVTAEQQKRISRAMKLLVAQRFNNVDLERILLTIKFDEKDARLWHCSFELLPAVPALEASKFAHVTK